MRRAAQVLPQVRRRGVLAAAALVLAVSALPAVAEPADGPAPASRLYLLQSDAGYQYWSVDHTDPELDGGSVVSRGGPTPLAQYRPESFAQITFSPGSVLAAPVAFGPEAPLRFHLALELATAAPSPTVTLALQKSGAEYQSAPATQVAPGVWEGVLSTPGSLGGAGLDMLVVRVRSLSPVHRLELGTAGRSWIDLPQPVGATSVPQLLAQSPRPAQPVTYRSATRSVTFNDDDYAIRTFSGDLGSVRTYDFTDDRPATAVLAWVDLPDTPPLSEPLHGRAPDPRAVTDQPTLVLSGDSGSLASGGRSVTAVEVPAGALSVRVQRSAASQATPYTLHVLSVYGQRTLHHTRWRMPATAGAFTAMGGTCGGGPGVVPTTAATTTFALDVDAASPNPTSEERWSPSFDLPGVGEAACASEGNEDEVRITVPGLARAWQVGATPQRDVAVVYVADTMLELEVRIAYTPVR